jgi:hydroxymethylpyrimidine/phosphomethylpyrimidine kinase
VLLKGGHLKGAYSTDLLYAGGKIFKLRGKRLSSRNTHGTGCALASAIAAHLSRGVPLPRACRDAHAFVKKAIATAPGLGKARGPLNLWAEI